MIRLMKGVVPVLLGLSLLGACHPDPGPSAAAAPAAFAHAAAPKPGVTAQQSTRGMVEAAEIGKSPLAVTVKFDLAGRPEVGRPLDVVIALMTRIAGGPASLQVKGSDGVSLAPAGSHLELAAVDPRSVYRQTVTVTPTLEGVQLVTVDVMLHHDDASESGEFAIPLIVAAAPR